MQPTISVIVPVYNGKAYLRACMDSILAQSYPYLEILAVNDGSADGSFEILQAYAQRDSRVIVIDRPHEGASAARNAALDQATGDYIGFIDSDDIASPELYRHLLNILQAHPADIAVCGFWFCFADGRQVRSYPHEGILLCDQAAAIANAVKGKPYAGHLWDKLFKAYLFTDVRFDPELAIFEDLHVFIRLMQRAELLVYDSQPLYLYFQRDTGAYAHADMKALASVRTAYRKFTELLAPSCQHLLADIRVSCAQYALLALERAASLPAAEAGPLRSQACVDIRMYWHEGMHRQLPGLDGWLGLSAKAGPIPYRITRSIFRLLQRVKHAFTKTA